MSHSHSPTQRTRLRIAAALGTVAFIGIVVGCMSFSIGGKTVIKSDEANAFEQEGAVELRPLEVRDIYYPIPYAAPPNLEITCTFHNNDIDLVDQHAEFFRIRNTSTQWSRDVDWKSRGVKTLPPPPPVTATQAPSSPLAPTNPPPPPPVPYTTDH
jgi:hypothetical protein